MGNVNKLNKSGKFLSLWADFALLVRLSRPLSTWPVGILLFLIGLHVSGASVSTVALANLAVLLLFPVIIFGLNDVYDYHTDSRSSRKSGLLEGKLLPKEKHRFVKRASAFSAALLLFFSLVIQNASNMAVTAGGIVLAYAYSVPPIRLKERPLLDSLSNFFTIAIPLLLGFSHGGTIAQFSSKLAYASLGGISIHALGAAMDYSSDRKAGVRTIATFFGKRFAAVFSAVVAAVILSFSGIKSVSLNSHVLLWFLISVTSFAVPKEALIRKLVIGGFLASVAAAGVFLYQQFYK